MLPRRSKRLIEQSEKLPRRSKRLLQQPPSTFVLPGKKIRGGSMVKSSVGNTGSTRMGCSTEKSAETSRIPAEKHKTAINKKNEKMTVSSTEPSIPTEIIIEILSWLQVKVLLRLKCVCKQWYAIIEGRHFIEKHISRTIIATDQYNTIAKTPAPAYSFQFMCGCDGLLLKMNNGSLKYFIENPTTRQILELPDPHQGSIDISLSFIPSTGDYKLVSIYDIDGKKAGNEGCEVLTVGTDDSWRPLKLPNLDDINKNRDRASVIVSIGSTVHCFRLFNVGSNIYQDVVSLDVETECFTVTALSQDLVPDQKKVEALSWNGKLSFVNRVQEVLHVLVLEDHKRWKWGEEFVISLVFLKENQDMMVDLVPLFAKNGDLWFRWKEEKYFAYNMESGTINHTIVAAQGHKITKKLYRSPPSLVTLKGMRQKAQTQMNQPS
ncbi:F-box protein At2g40925-like [Cornus florida]|uniref:F-box protein At2g40925-like n=1 Tax=Cornus florida TaxID=4283 RepID=UPI0028997C0D|nr:F-box protein At2g40925-like [Cornus florida]